jgi:hypothetical protein
MPIILLYGHKSFMAKDLLNACLLEERNPICGVSTNEHGIDI